MLQCKVNQMFFSPPFLLVALIYLFLPLCTASCECQTNNTVPLEIVEKYGQGSTTSTFIIDFLEGYTADYFVVPTWNPNDRERVFEKYFELDESNLSTKGWIDREDIAKDLGDPYSRVRFEFEIDIYNYDATIEEEDCKCVTLDVIDLDDNSPNFGTEQKVVEFHEDNTEVGRKLDIPIAVDDDEAGNGTSVYELMDESGKFELVYNYYSDTLRVKALSLRHTSPLDYEQQPSYQLELHASEDNESPDEDVLSILVRVLDSCDEPVMFTTSRYTPSVIEEMGDVPIVKVEATDDDNHTNCPLTYEITKACRRETNLQTSNCENIPIQPLFTLDSESGQLTLLEELDRESYSEYEVTIRASDGQHSTATAMVVISVEDINDNPPVVVDRILTRIPEKQQPGQRALGVVTVTDDDAGENGTTTVYLLDNSTGIREESQTFRLIKQTETQYRFVLNRSLDFETQREISLIIQAQDHGINSHTVEKHVLIQILDINDHPPEFVNLPAAKIIPENSKLNTHVLTVETRDGDEEEHAVITYELPESNATYPYQHLFQIEPEIGKISVRDVVLDYENVTSYTILVVAINSESDELLSSSAELTILLENLNDEKPQITVNPISVNETAEHGETIGQVIATDADNLAPLIYTLRTYTSIFSISGDGTISLEGDLDYETVTSYPVTVEVSDGNHTSEATVTIDVLPVNDEIPVFNHSGPYMASIAEEGPDKISVINVTATDADNPPQDLRYSIVDGIHRERFSISPSGEISTTQVLDREAAPNYTLSIKANDGKFDSDLKEVIIIVTDINDHTPEFVGEPYKFCIEERNPPFRSVGHVSVLSLDEGINQMVRFRLLPGSGYDWFQIDENTGNIKINNRVFDYETDSSHIELTVIVTDLGLPPKTNTTIVNVEIVDINDNSPEFTRSEYNFTLREDYPTGQVFGAVVAEDIDGIGNNNTIYRFSEDTDAEGFRIEESTGELSLVSSLDFETTNVTTFKVIATDAGRGDFQSSPTTVVITITNARDLNLTFPDDFIPRFSVHENIEANYTITSLEVTDHMYNSIDRLIYSLTTEDDEQSPYFGLRKEGHTAFIYTRTHTINREADDIGDDKTYRLKLNVSDPDPTPDSYGYIVSYLTIEILDENDNRPQLVTDLTEFSVVENGNAGEMVTTIEVRDPDAGNNGTIRLSIETIVPFNVTHKVQNDGRQFAVIKVVSPLDRETQSTYNFFLRAADMGTPSSHTAIEITVDVIDVNDNYPEFSKEEYTFHVPENRDMYVIGRVHATDLDEGSNSLDRYEVVPGYELVAIDSVFRLQNTGHIKLLKSLDRETKCEYTFNVRAVDGGNQADTATVVVTVTDVNEFQPAFTNSSFTTTIPENTPIGVPFTSLVAEDQDKSPNALVQYALADDSLSKIFCLDPQTGGISICDPTPPEGCKFPNAIDYERKNEYKVGIIAYDNGEPRKYSNVTLTVQITDVNEHVPMFDVSSLSITMSENTAVGAIVLEIQAYDRDLADNLQYSFVHQHPGTHFQWDNENSALILSSPVEYMTTPTLAVRLRADDGEKHNEIEIFVTVLNENNHRPIFETQDSTISVSEMAEKESEIFRVHATDSDNATNDAVVYSISNGNIGNTFYINPKTGVLYIAQALDYETEPSYSLTIIATDTGIPALVSEPLTLTIQIINQNDEVPIFVETEYTFSLTEEKTAVTEVGRVSAEDRDEGSFGIVVYSIVEEGEYPGFFSIDKSSGKISAIKTVDREVIDEFQLMVEARDNENPALKDTVSVIVVVSDINDNGPTFTQNYFNFYISSDHDISETVGTITAIDRDHGENASFTYGIVTQDPDLEISLSDNGTVTLVAAIPNDYQASYSVEVQVSSNVLGDTRSDSATILIIVETETDHNPRFSEQVYEEHVSESMDVGHLVFDASEVVTDPDGTSQLEYSFVGSYDQFELDLESGRLTLQESLNYEATDSYEIQIQVIDTFSSRRRTATATIRVIVEDGNDHAPVFTLIPTDIILSPVPYTNIEIFKVKATDDDIGDQGTVRYSIVEKWSNTFDIDPETGAVTNRVNLVANNSYVFVIRAYDRGVPLMSSNATVHIRIADPTNSPQFLNGDTTIEISMAEDRDFETDSVIQEFSTHPTADSYHLVYSNASKDMFGIEMSNLVLKSQLDYETASRYLLIIEARSIDSNGMRLSSFLLVNIIVTDVNDNRPQFLPLTTREISESVPTTTQLFTVEAIDDDSDPNAAILYVISDGNFNNTFEIHPTMGIVKLVKPLDREVRASYNLTIRATDSGANQLQNETTVFIEVVDVNDNAPTFSHPNYSISVFEHPHTDIGDAIMQIVAKDKDTTPSVSYTLQLLEGTYNGNIRQTASDTFDIDFDTGNITTHRRLDREEVDRYLIRIEARDSIHTAVTNLTVYVLDVNDHSPEFPNRPDKITVYELEPVDSEVLGRQLVTDRDIGQNSIVKYYLADGWPAGDFKIDPWTGVIRIARTFSFDMDDNEFEGTVLAVDQGFPARTGTTRVTVTIQDVNNFPPELDDSHFKFDLAYNHSVNTPIAKFNYSDERDQTYNSGTTIKIPNYYSDAKNLFEINPLGELKLRKDPSSYVGEHTFRIEALQKGILPLCPQYIQATYAHVKVIIHPQNRNSPVFDSLIITAEIEESATVGYELFISGLVATDEDDDAIFYSILSSENLPFAISEPSSPTITTTALLDADLISTSEYTLTVRAKDGGFPARSTDVTLVIRVKDVNDLPPVFENKSYNGWVTENSAEGTLILTVSAIDLDREISNTIHYSIEYSDSCDANCLPFDIRPSGAIVTTSEQIDYEKDQSYTFLVKASDGHFTSNVSVTIDVSGVNEDRPEFVKKVFMFTVPRGQADGKIVGRVMATDSDIGTEGDLRYSFVDKIEEEYNVFIIDEKSGNISLNLGTTEQRVKSVRKRSVDVMEDNVIVSRVVMVQDLGSPPKNDTAEVIITIDKGYFQPIDMPEPRQTFSTIIIIVVTAVVAAIIVFIAIFVCALICQRHHSQNKKFKVEEAQMNGNGRCGTEMSERYCRNENGTPLDGKPSKTKLHTGISASGSEHSYTADDEMDSGNEGPNHFSGHSPSLSNKPPRNNSPHVRSTSDLASSVGTDALHSQANEHPYTKAQLVKIYADNEDLLDDNVSHDSVRMFGSEGGGEADGDYDINNLINQKINDLEDDEESNVMMDDDASTTYSKGRGTTLAGSAGNLDLLPAEDREDPLNYPKGWIPPSGRPIDETIDEITSRFASQEAPLPRRHGYEMGGYSHSQGPSLYNPSATQESFIGIQPPPKLHHHYHHRPYYHEDKNERLARDHEHDRPRYTPRSNHRYGSASVLPANPGYLHGHRQHYHSQELAPPYSKYSPSYIHGVRRPMGHNHAYMTPPEGTDGTVTPQTALTGDYNYLSSSSTSLTSTNVSGNLSQPSRRPQMYN